MGKVQNNIPEDSAWYHSQLKILPYLLQVCGKKKKSHLPQEIHYHMEELG